MTTTSTLPRYHHDPRYYRVAGRTVARHLAAIADHLDRIGTPDADLVARLDELVDVLLPAEARADRIVVELDASEVAA